MSDESSHSYQTQTSEIPTETVNHDSVSATITERLVENQKAMHQNSNDIEREQSEGSSESTSEEPKKDEFSSKFAALSRKEKEVRSRERELETKISEYENKMKELETPSTPKEEAVVEEIPLEHRLKKDPLGTLESLGLSYETLTDLALNDGKLTTDMQMNLMREEMKRDYETKFEQLNSKLVEKEKAEEESKYNSVLSNFKNEISDTVNSSEEYELIQANEAQDLVYDVIEQYYQENGRVLDINQAAKEVEAYLEEETTKVLKKTKKFESWKNEASERAVSSTRQSPTLSNSHSAAGAPAAANRTLSREESIKQAAQMIKWED